MRCPLCDATMRAVNRRGVEVDVCPECKGIWLDRGELEKLMTVADEEEDDFDRRTAGKRRVATETRRDDDDRRRSDDDDDRRRSYDDDDHRRSYDDDDHRSGEPKKKKSWFSQMMEAVGGDD